MVTLVLQCGFQFRNLLQERCELNRETTKICEENDQELQNTSIVNESTITIEEIRTVHPKKKKKELRQKVTIFQDSSHESRHRN